MPQRGKKIGNAHLKWAFSEAACLMLQSSPRAKAWMQRQEKKRGKRKALAVLEARIGRAVYHLWKKQVPFEAKRFLTSRVTTRCHAHKPKTASKEKT